MKRIMWFLTLIGVLLCFIAFPIGLAVHGIVFIAHGNVPGGIICLAIAAVIYGAGQAWANDWT